MTEQEAKDALRRWRRATQLHKTRKAWLDLIDGFPGWMVGAEIAFLITRHWQLFWWTLVAHFLLNLLVNDAKRRERRASNEMLRAFDAARPLELWKQYPHLHDWYNAGLPT